MLQAAVQALEPGTAGRPAQEATPEQEQIALLQQQLAHLEAELKAAQVREEIALGLPNVVQKPAAPEKKTPRPGQLGRRPRPPKPTGA